MVAGAGIEPARKRLMRPLPSHLATPQLLKLARRLGAAPSRQSFGDFAAHWRPPCVLKNWCGQPESHRHRLIGIQASCSWTMTANERRGLSHPRRIRQKRTNTAANSELEFAPAGYFTAVLSVFQAHLPMHRYIDSAAKPLDWKSQGRGIRQYRSVRQPIEGSTDLTLTPRAATV